MDLIEKIRKFEIFEMSINGLLGTNDSQEALLLNVPNEKDHKLENGFHKEIEGKFE